jgi:hypothetical protein
MSAEPVERGTSGKCCHEQKEKHTAKLRDRLYRSGTSARLFMPPALSTLPQYERQLFDTTL